jgi:hypothetical protein
MEFRRGDLVKLFTRNLWLKNKKLQPRWIGPFRVTERIGSQAYRLALPEAYQALHDVFPIQLLEKYHPREGDPPLSMPKLEEDDGEWEIEEVLNTAKKNGQVRWLVKWKGWPSEYNQWVNDSDMDNARGAIHKYQKTQNSKKVARASSIEVVDLEGLFS